MTNESRDVAAPGPKPRPAATLVLIRAGRRGPEVLLTVRPENLRFMGGATVFPGGAVSEADRDPRWERASERKRAEAARLLGMPDGGEALGVFVCALREAFEEVGYIASAGPVEALERSDADHPGRFLERCLELGVVLGTDEMVPAGRWVTPLGAPIRFDAHFFLMRCGDDFEPVPDPAEVASWRWATPRAALDDLGEGRALMAPPTIEMLQRLDVTGSVDEILDAVAAKPLAGTGDVISVRVSPLVHVVVAPNPSPMTGPGTNTYVVGTGPTFVIDPAVDDPRYLDAVVEAAGEIAAILVTHRHEDHVGGVSALVDRAGAPVRAFGTDAAGGVDVIPLGDGDVLEAGGATLRALYAPGHASDHVCFYLEGAASLFAGDNVLGEGTAVIIPPDGDMKTYIHTLRRLSAMHVDRIYTGHFRSLDGGTQVIDGYLAHRAERERQVKAALSDGPLTAEEVVERVYVDTPLHLHPIALHQVLAHLEMLVEEGAVECRDDRWSVKDVG